MSPSLAQSLLMAKVARFTKAALEGRVGLTAGQAGSSSTAITWALQGMDLGAGPADALLTLLTVLSGAVAQVLVWLVEMVAVQIRLWE